jgi:hypothetical protein
VTHANAPLTPLGRERLAKLIVDKGWPVRRAAERFQVSPATGASRVTNAPTWTEGRWCPNVASSRAGQAVAMLEEGR